MSTHFASDISHLCFPPPHLMEGLLLLLLENHKGWQRFGNGSALMKLGLYHFFLQETLVTEACILTAFLSSSRTPLTSHYMVTRESQPESWARMLPTDPPMTLSKYFLKKWPPIWKPNPEAVMWSCVLEHRTSSIRCDVEMVNMVDHNFGNEKDSELATHPLTVLVMGLYDSLWEDWRPTWQAHRHHSIMWIRGVALNLPSHHRGLNHTLLWNVWDCERVRLTIDTSVSLLIKEFSWFASRGKKNGKFD